MMAVLGRSYKSLEIPDILEHVELFYRALVKVWKMQLFAEHVSVFAIQALLCLLEPLVVVYV